MDGVTLTARTLSDAPEKCETGGSEVGPYYARVLAQVSLLPAPDIGDVPLAINEAQNEADRQLLALVSSTADLGQSFVAPGGVPDRVIEILRRGFDATMKDKDFLAEMEKAQLDVLPGQLGGDGGEELGGDGLVHQQAVGRSPPSILQQCPPCFRTPSRIFSGRWPLVLIIRTTCCCEPPDPH